MTNDDPTEEQIHAFLLGLRELTIKYGIGISGCGCCGSPFLVSVDLAEPCGYTHERGNSVEWKSLRDAQRDLYYSADLIRPGEGER